MGSGRAERFALGVVVWEFSQALPRGGMVEDIGHCLFAIFYGAGRIDGSPLWSRLKLPGSPPLETLPKPHGLRLRLLEGSERLAEEYLRCFENRQTPFSMHPTSLGACSRHHSALWVAFSFPKKASRCPNVACRCLNGAPRCLNAALR